MEYPVDEAIFEKCHINPDMLKAMLYVTEFRKAICNTTEKINYSWTARTFLDIANRHSAGEIEIPKGEWRSLHRQAKYFQKREPAYEKLQNSNFAPFAIEGLIQVEAFCKRILECESVTDKVITEIVRDIQNQYQRGELHLSPHAYKIIHDNYKRFLKKGWYSIDERKNQLPQEIKLCGAEEVDEKDGVSSPKEVCGTEAFCDVEI